MERVLSTALATALVMTPAITVMAEEQDDLLAEKNDLEQKYADTVAQVVKVMKEFDSSGLKPLVKDTEEFLKEENDKTCEMLVYQELAKDWQGNKDKGIETGVITMNAVIPAIGAVGGLGLLALKRKKKKNG